MTSVLILLSAVVAAWFLAFLWNRRSVAAVDGSGNTDLGVVVFVEPVRWLFMVWGFASFVSGLRRGGCGHYVRLFRWSSAVGALLVVPDLVRRDRLLRKAARLGRFIDRLAARKPGHTIHICAYSSGCYVAMEALKQATTRHPLGTVILLSPTASPAYRVQHVLERACSLRSFHSRADFIISGLAPLIFGCNDGPRSLSAGMVGFRPATPQIGQHGWSWSDVMLGYLGDHFSVTSARFVAARIAPLLDQVQRPRPGASGAA